MPVGVCTHARVCVHTCSVRVHMCTRRGGRPFHAALAPALPSLPRGHRYQLASLPVGAVRLCGSAQEAAGHVWTRPSSETSLCPGRGEGKREGPKGLWGDTWAFPRGPVLLGRVSGPSSARHTVPAASGLGGVVRLPASQAPASAVSWSCRILGWEVGLGRLDRGQP